MSLFTFGDLEPYTNYENSNGQNILVNIFNPFSGFTTPSVIQPSHITISGSITIPGGNVSFLKSDGTNAIIFNSVQDGLTCLQFMHSKGMYYLQLSDDITLINISGVKLLILETTFLNQKLMNAFHFSYMRGKVRATHRNLSYITNLTQALVSVGYQHTGSQFSNNYSLQGALTSGSYTYIQIFDKNYLTSSLTSGSMLEDANPIVYVDESASAIVGGS